MKTSDELIRAFGDVRQRRNRLRSERAVLFCERHEASVDIVDENTPPIPSKDIPEPCWKAARKWRDNGYRNEFYFDPQPSEWCPTCRKRQEVSDAYRQAVRDHGGALRGLLRRAKALTQERETER